MKPLIECIPNISEGRDLEALERLWSELKQQPELQCLHRSSDPDHNRSVLTLAGTPTSIKQALDLICAWALEQIDLRQHQGVHPRIGALDVIPLVPLQNISQAEAIEYSKELARHLAERWQLPIYLYEDSAASFERSALPDIRKGGFEGLKLKMQQPHWKPDLGPEQPHPSLGASVLGVRKPLIAWNVFLESQDLALAEQIARQIRSRNGGFAALRALGFYLPHRQQIQVSMNLLDFEQTSLFEVMQQIRQLAQQQQVKVNSTEFIGLVPRRALMQSAWEYLQAEGQHVLQSVLEEQFDNLSSL